MFMGLLSRINKCLYFAIFASNNFIYCFNVIYIYIYTHRYIKYKILYILYAIYTCVAYKYKKKHFTHGLQLPLSLSSGLLPLLPPQGEASIPNLVYIPPTHAFELSMQIHGSQIIYSIGVHVWC